VSAGYCIFVLVVCLHLHCTISCSLTHSLISTTTAAENNLIGEIPSEIQEFSSLEILELYRNKLMGMIPDSVMELEELTMLDIEENELTGNPFIVLQKMPKLQNVRVSKNLFAGELDNEALAPMRDLRTLWMAENMFKGPFPGAIGNLRELGTFGWWF